MTEKSAKPPKSPAKAPKELKAPAAADAPPDRLSNDPESPHHHPELLARGIGIRFKGQERTNVEEYCVSEGWIRATVGNSMDRRGNPLTLKVHGPVEAYFKDDGGEK